MLLELGLFDKANQKVGEIERICLILFKHRENGIRSMSDWQVNKLVIGEDKLIRNKL